MNEVDGPRRASFGLSLLVALLWQFIVILVVLIDMPGMPAIRDCSQTCLSWAITLIWFFGGLLFAGFLIVTLPIIALLRRWIASPILTGTLSALFGVVAVAAAAMVMHGLP